MAKDKIYFYNSECPLANTPNHLILCLCSEKWKIASRHLKARMPFYQHVRQERGDQERSGIKHELKGCVITKNNVTLVKTCYWDLCVLHPYKNPTVYPVSAMRARHHAEGGILSHFHNHTHHLVNPLSPSSKSQKPDKYYHPCPVAFQVTMKTIPILNHWSLSS